MIGVDTLELELQGVEVSPNNALEVEQTFTAGDLDRPKHWKALYADTNGKVIVGKKVYFNSKNWHFDIKRQRQGRNEVAVARVHFSPAKVVRGENYEPADAETLRVAMERVEGELETEAGVKTKLDLALPSRVDATRNLILSRPYETYKAVAECLGGSLMKNRTEYPDGYLIQNTQRELSLYDKRVEMEKRGLKVDRLPSTVMRCEARAKSQASVRTYVNIETLGDLRRNFGRATEAFDKIAGYIFRDTPADFEGKRLEEYREVLDYFRKRGGRNWMSKALTTIGGEELYRQVGRPDTLRRLFYDIGYNKAEVYRLVKRVSEAHRFMSGARFTDETRSVMIADLYAEMREQVFSKVA